MLGTPFRVSLQPSRQCCDALSTTAVSRLKALIPVQAPDGDLLDAARPGASADGMLDAFNCLDLQQAQRGMHPWHQQQQREAGVAPRLAASLPRRAATAGMHWEQHRRQRTAAAR